MNRHALAERYRTTLLEDTVPFWLEHALDPEHGGYLTALDRTGAVVDDDKSIWAQGRFAWLLATLYATVEPRAEWLDAARSGIDFLDRHGFDDDGRMLFLVTRDGRPLRKRRYVFSEAFASMAFAAFARATGSDDHAARATSLFARYVSSAIEPGLVAPKFDHRGRDVHSISPWMLAIRVAQTLRDTIGYDGASTWIDRCIDEIERHFVRPELEAVLETVAADGSVIDHFDGRTLNPGHAIEAAWFILHEARERNNDAHLADLGCRMLDWSWRRGWDPEHGGLLSFVDLHGGPVQEYWHDMKFWWPHCEAIIATLLAHQLTGDERYAQWHGLVHDWAHSHFADPEHGEWFGYLHRDGSRSSSLKGNWWKGPFHVPRMQWYASWLLSE